MSAWTPPAAFEEILLIKPLGKGAMGEVWLGHDALLDRPVAVKFIASAEPDDHLRRRFLTEARAVARLAHPNVVTVHRAGEVEGRPYLVSEFIAGRTLDALQRPVPRELVLRVAVGLARGLAAAHERGILHRDIKPSNVVLSDRDEVKLLDFGIAKMLEDGTGTRSEGTVSGTRPGALVGTPLYMAPEALRGEPATPRSDLYSLGAVLHDLWRGVQPARDRATRELLAADPPLGAIVDRCLREAPGERFASAAELVSALELLLPGARAEGNPYRGLRPFEEEHSAIFFGRGPEAAEVVERLRSERFVLVAGDSGVGKSSLCRAGVLPRVREGALDAKGRTAIVCMVPGRTPIRALANALAPFREENAEALAAWLRDEPAALPRALPPIRGVSMTLLFVDQLEELLTLGPQENRKEAEAFAAALAALAASDAQARILAAVRGDFFTRLAALPGVGELFPRALFLLRPMTDHRLRETVVEPAQLSGMAFESEKMVEDLVADAAHAGGGLPLLQFTMAELWNARDVSARRIPASALENLGGVGGALTRHADEVIARLLPAQRAAVRRMLLQLVTTHGTRARASAAQLAGEQPDARSALEALVQGRLVVAHESEGGTEYEVAHEALLTSWRTLRQWLESDGDRQQIRARIAAAAEEWHRLGKTGAALWDRTRLQEAARVDQAELSALQVEFLAASSRRLTRLRRTRLLVLVAGPLLLLAVIAAVRWRTQAELGATAAVRHARGVEQLDEARRLDALATGAREEAMAQFVASRTSKTWHKAESAWGSVAEQRLAADAAYEVAELAFASALAIDPFQTSSRTGIAQALFLRARLARRFGDERVSTRLAKRLAASQASNDFFPPARLSIEVEPAGVEVSIASFMSRGGKIQLSAPRILGKTPLSVSELPAGSHLLLFRDARSREFRLPVLAEGSISVKFALPSSVPDGYVFVPPGEFLNGFSEDEGMRRALGAVPAHRATTGAYLIARNEVTFANYVAFLESLPAPEGKKRMPFHRSGRSSLELRRTAAGWKILMQPTVHPYSAAWGEPIRYRERTARAVQDWRKFPVAAVSLQDAEAYVKWLSSHGLPGAHVCDDLEWERAARGADGRLFTNAEVLDAAEVNIDETYGRNPLAYGPDEVGSHPESASVFGVQDMVGNIMEMVRTVGGFGVASIRGGSWYYDEWSARLPARFTLEPTTRSAMVGFRVCAAAVD